MQFKTVNLVALICCGLIAAMNGCGGSFTPSSPTPSATCTPSIIATADTAQCTAQPSGSSVDWSASAGTITSAGQFTAPAASGSITITATSTANRAKSAEATVNVIALPSSRHVVMVLEENLSYSAVAGNTTDWPNLNRLITSGSLATGYYANAHPSIGDYFMISTGQLLTADDASTMVWNVDNIARRMLTARASFRIYAEGIDWGYLGGDTGLYVIRHNPFAMISDIAGDPAMAKAVLAPFSQFAIDLANNMLPAFSFIVPNVNDDAHEGTPQQADSWLQKNVVSLLAQNAAFNPGGDGMLVIDFDEAAVTDTTNGGGLVAVTLWGPIIRQGYQQTTTTTYQHQSMLRTVMLVLGLTDPPAAAATAPTMAEFFVSQ
jgi:acid phosphatase